MLRKIFAVLLFIGSAMQAIDLGKQLIYYNQATKVLEEYATAYNLQYTAPVLQQSGEITLLAVLVSLIKIAIPITAGILLMQADAEIRKKSYQKEILNAIYGTRCYNDKQEYSFEFAPEDTFEETLPAQDELTVDDMLDLTGEGWGC